MSSSLISCSNTNKSSLCQSCQIGKHVRLPFRLSQFVAQYPFQIIHSDVWTSLISSLTIIKYYVIFLDNFSHFLWVYPLRKKFDVNNKFQHFCQYIQTQFQTKIQSFQYDNGGEYNNSKFCSFCDSNVIQLRFSCPHTSQQNGKFECMLRTINKVIRTLLFHDHVPQ